MSNEEKYPSRADLVKGTAKRCRKCGILKWETEFIVQGRRLHSFCKLCNCKLEADRVARKRKELDTHYLVSTRLQSSNKKGEERNYKRCTTNIEIVKARFTTKCEICNKECGTAIHLDHCHITGELRGFLCKDCNHIFCVDIGIERLEKAIAYLKKFEQENTEDLLEVDNIEKLLEL